MMRVIRVGTRGSNLARWQTAWAMQQLRQNFPEVELEEVIIRVESDRQPDAPITSMSSRGVFTRDIEVALLSGSIDVAVHSLKDLPSEDAPGLVVAAVSPREDPRDALLTADGITLDRLPHGAVVGTSSVRRSALLLEARPDLRVEPLRGNIDTRLRKLMSGEYDAIVMAAAALRRLDRDVPAQPLPSETWVPAVAQGVIGIQCRSGDEDLRKMLEMINNAEADYCASLEREYLRSLGGGCSVPVGGLATVDEGGVTLRAFVGSPDGRRCFRVVRTAARAAGDGLARQVARDLMELGGSEVLAGLRARVPIVAAEAEQSAEVSPDISHEMPNTSSRKHVDVPLRGSTVLVTRAREQAAELSELLRQRGAEPIALPTIHIQPPRDWTRVDTEISRLSTYDWVVFTSVNGARIWAERMAHLDAGSSAWGSVKVAAIGPATARALTALGVIIELVPSEYIAESLLEELLRRGVRDKRILLPRAAEARKLLAIGLAKNGAQVESLELYSTRGTGVDSARAMELLRAGKIDVATFTSSSTVRNFVDLAPDDAAALLDSTCVVCIGPVTGATARELGIRVDAEAAEHTMSGLVATVERIIRDRGRRTEHARAERSL